VTTCPPENGGSACKESDIKKTVTPFKVCYQAGEDVRPGVDVALWQVFMHAYVHACTSACMHVYMRAHVCVHDVRM